MFKLKINLDRQGPRPLSNIWLLPDPPFFSFPPTFNKNLSKELSRILLLFQTEDLSREIVKSSPPNEIQTVPFVLSTQAIHPNLIYHVSIINRHPRKVCSRKTPGDFSSLSFSLCKHWKLDLSFRIRLSNVLGVESSFLEKESINKKTGSCIFKKLLNRIPRVRIMQSAKIRYCSGADVRV